MPLDLASLDARLRDARSREIAVVADRASCMPTPTHAHERAVARLVRARAAGSRDRALERRRSASTANTNASSTTVVNALLGPLVAAISNARAGVAALGIAAPRVRDAIQRRVSAALEPSLGIPADARSRADRPPARSGRRRWAGVSVSQRLLSFDMGGTTAKAGDDRRRRAAGRLRVRSSGPTHCGRAVKGSGYPVRFPFVDFAEVSAGGGTIARRRRCRLAARRAALGRRRSRAGRVTDAACADGHRCEHRARPAQSGARLSGGALPIDARRSREAVARRARARMPASMRPRRGHRRARRCRDGEGRCAS